MMQQAWHILMKDARYLRREIYMLVALSAVFIRVSSLAISIFQLVLVLASSYIIARLVHAESIPGDKQFWLTRPYRRSSLLAAKLLFILIFVNLPILAARFTILAGEGFPIAANLPGLLWSQVLLILGIWFPVAALSAITSRI